MALLRSFYISLEGVPVYPIFKLDKTCESLDNSIVVRAARLILAVVLTTFWTLVERSE